MATPKKLPSGHYRIRVYSHTDQNGRKVYKSFTDKDPKKLRKLAHQFQATKDDDNFKDEEITFQAAMRTFLQEKEKTLSPKTYSEYCRMAEKDYDKINTLYISRITDKDMQYFIASLNRLGKSPKTVRNIYALAMSVIRHHLGKTKKFDVDLPEKKKIFYHLPNDNQLKQLIDEASDQMKICIYLSAVGTLRRSEICGLKYKDVLYDMNAIYIHGAKVQNVEKRWVYKNKTKTSDSERRVILPKSIIEMIGHGEPEEFVIKMTPNAITAAFCKLRNNLGLKCRFHDLRHYAATIRMYMGIPIKEIQAVGGWSSSKVLENIYINQIEAKSNEFTKKANNYFEDNLLSKPDKTSIS